MIRQIRVELTRALWRRAVLVLLLAAVALPVLLAVGVGLTTSQPSPQEVSAVERDYERYQRQTERDVQRCIERPGRYGIEADADDPAAVEATCREYLGLASFEEYAYFDTLDLDEERRDGSGLGVAVILAVLLFLLGTTFAGHDWNTGSMTNQLLFEPRRLRVWTAKAIALTLAGLVAAVVGATAFWFLLNGFIGLRDFPEPRDGALVDALQHGWRAAGFAAVAALFGYVLTMLTRSTVFTIGLMFGFSVAGGILIGVLGPDDPGWIDPAVNAAAIIEDGHEYWVEVPQSCYESMMVREDGECDSSRVRSLGEGVAFYGILLGALGAASAGSFRRRDVG